MHGGNGVRRRAAMGEGGRYHARVSVTQVRATKIVTQCVQDAGRDGTGVAVGMGGTRGSGCAMGASCPIPSGQALKTNRLTVFGVARKRARLYVSEFDRRNFQTCFGGGEMKRFHEPVTSATAEMTIKQSSGRKSCALWPQNARIPITRRLRWTIPKLRRGYFSRRKKFSAGEQRSIRGRNQEDDEDFRNALKGVIQLKPAVRIRCILVCGVVLIYSRNAPSTRTRYQRTKDGEKKRWFGIFSAESRKCDVVRVRDVKRETQTGEGGRDWLSLKT